MFKIDTGAQCNVIPQWLYYQLSKDPLQPSSASLVAFGGHKVHTCGKAKIPCQYKDNNYLFEFEVVDHNVPNIVGLVTCIDMNLVQRIDTIGNNLFEQYYNVFEGLGCVTDIHYHIKIDPTETPVIHPPRRVPITLRPRIQNELERMESLDVIKKATEPTNWVNSMATIIKPNGSLRICIDSAIWTKLFSENTTQCKPLKKLQHGCQMPPISQFWMPAQATGKSVLTKKVPSSAHSIPFGRYMFKCLPFGLSSAQDIFQKSDDRNVWRHRWCRGCCWWHSCMGSKWDWTSLQVD